MASVCRSAIIAGARSVTTRSRTIVSTLASKPLRSSPIPSSTRVLPCAASRIASVLGGAESMMPLHSAIASARLRSSIAVDSACWGWLSQGLAIPL